MPANRPKQLIRFERGKNGKSNLVLDEIALSSILKKVGTTKVAVISATGIFRSGKSYFLNYVHRYFTWEQDEDEDWMGWACPNTNLEGFAWKFGSDIVTSGIWIWPEPLMVKSNSGKVISLLLMDTQGTLNEFTTEDESLALTTLCLLLSSVTIYNVKYDIDQENIQLIKKSLELCSQLIQKDCHLRDLLFTVRDWSRPNEFGFGIENGSKYLEQKLEVRSGLTEDARMCRELIKESFKRISCSLFPDPGDKVKSPTHTGHLADVGPLFATTVEEIPICFDVDNLHDKTVGANSMEFLKKFKTCVKLLNERQVQPFALKFQKNSTHEHAFEIYKEYMNNHPEEFFSAEDVKVVHDVALQKSASFLENENRGTPYGMMKELQNQFETITMQHYQTIVLKSVKKGDELRKALEEAKIAAKEMYSDGIKQCFSKNSVSEKHSHLKHNMLKEEILSTFSESVPKMYRHLNFEHQVKNLEKEFDSIYLETKRNWQFRKQASINSQWELDRPTALEEYKTRMKEGLGGQSFVQQIVLRNHHEKVQKFVVDKYCRSFFYEDSAANLEAQLRNDMNEVFEALEKSNTEKTIEAIEGRLEKALATALQNYRQKLSVMDIELTEEDFINRNVHTKEEMKTLFLAEIDLEPEHVKSEFLNKLNCELDEINKSATERFQLVMHQYFKLLENNKREIQNEAFEVLDRGYREDLFKIGRADEIGTTVLEQTIVKLDTVKKNFKVPSKMLAQAQSETMDAIKQKIKDVDAVRGKKIFHYEQGANRLVEECFALFKSKMENLEDIDSEYWLEKYRLATLEGCTKEFKDKCLVKEETWVQPFVIALEEKTTKFYEGEVKKLFLLELQQSNLEQSRAENEATKLYREEMDKHFKKKPFTLPAKLFSFHSKITTRIVNEVARRLKLKENQKAKLIRFIDEDYKTYETINKSNTPTDDVSIGIDLGTTFTCAAIYERGCTRIIPNENGGATFPSYVSFTPQGELVGDAAKEMAHFYPQNTIFDAKRLIGRRFDESEVQKDMKNWPFEVINEENVPKIKVVVNGQQQIFAPETISAKVLRHVKVMAEKHLGKDVKKAVVTVPAYFNEGQRQATRDAAEIAGYEKIDIITEPTAAAMAFHLETQGVRHERNVLVYDLGGGTFDVVVLNMKPGGVIEVKSINGDTHLGGEDFDDKLLNEIVRRYKVKNGVDLSAGKNSLKVDEKATAARILRRLRNACEKTKINISGGENKHGEVNVDALLGEKDLLEPVTRKEFEDLNMDLFLKTLDVVGKALKDAKLEKDDIHDIVLVGGSTRIPKVQKMLSEYFGGKTLQATVNPDEAVARGAAIHAAILNGNQEQVLKKMSLKDVTPLSLGIEILGGGFSSIIPRNTPIPCSATEDYYTADNCGMVEITIHEGEEKIANDNHLLGKFTMKELPKKKDEKVLVKMYVNSEGILKVKATCPSTGSTGEITIEDNRGRLSVKEKDKLKKEFRAPLRRGLLGAQE